MTSAALIYPEGAGQDEGADGQASAFEAAGIPIKVVSYPADTPDLTVPLIAAGAQDVDLVMPVINPNDCVKFAAGDPAARASPTRRCSPARSASTPTWPPGSATCRSGIYAVASSLSIDPTDPSVPPYTDILTAQGHESMIGDPWMLVGFGQTMTLAKFLNAVGPDNLTPDAIVERDEGLQGSADPRLARAPVRQVPGGARRLQRLHAVLQVQRRRRVGAGRRLRGSARRVGRRSLLSPPPITARPPRAPSRS